MDDGEDHDPKAELQRLKAIASQLAVRATEASRQAELERQAEEARERANAQRAVEQERVAREVEAVRLAATRAAQQAAETSARQALNEAVQRQRDAERAAAIAAAQASADARMRSAAAAAAAAEAARIAAQQRVAAEAARAAAAAAQAAAEQEARQRAEEQRRLVEAARLAAEEREAVRRAAEEQAWRQLELAEEAAWSLVSAAQHDETAPGNEGQPSLPEGEYALHAAACRRATEVVARRVAAGELTTHAGVQAALEEVTHEAYAQLVQQQQQQQQQQQGARRNSSGGGSAGGALSSDGRMRYNAYTKQEDLDAADVARARAHARMIAQQEEARHQAEREAHEQLHQDAAAEDEAAAMADEGAPPVGRDSTTASDSPSAQRTDGPVVIDAFHVHAALLGMAPHEVGAVEQNPLPEAALPINEAARHAEQPPAAFSPSVAQALQEKLEEQRRQQWAAAEAARVAALWAEHDEIEAKAAIVRASRSHEEEQRQALLRILAGEPDEELAQATAQVLSRSTSPVIGAPGSPRAAQYAPGSDFMQGVLRPRLEAAPEGGDGGHEAPVEAAASPAAVTAPEQPQLTVADYMRAAQTAARDSAAAARRVAAILGDPEAREQEAGSREASAAAVNDAFTLARDAEFAANQLLTLGLRLPASDAKSNAALNPPSPPAVGFAAASVALLQCATQCEVAAVQLGLPLHKTKPQALAGRAHVLAAAAVALQAACSDAAHQEEYVAALHHARQRKKVESEVRAVAEAAGELASRSAKHALAKKQQQQQEAAARQRAEALRAEEARQRARQAARSRGRARGGALTLPQWDQPKSPFSPSVLMASGMPASAISPPASPIPPEQPEVDEETAIARARARAAAIQAAEEQGLAYEEPEPPAPAVVYVNDSEDARAVAFAAQAEAAAAAAVLRPHSGGRRRRSSPNARGGRSSPPTASSPHGDDGQPAIDFNTAEHRLRALEAAMEAHRLLAADQAIQALPLHSRMQVDQAVADITAAADGDDDESPTAGRLQRALPPREAGVPVPRSMSATMAAATSVGESALQTLQAIRANRRAFQAA